MRIILTRQPAQAGHIEAGLAQLGHTIEFLPLTDFQHPEDTGALDETVEGLHTGRWDRVLLTSPNTIRALVARGWEPAVTEREMVIAVTGPGTARVLYDFGAQQRPWMPTDDASAAGILEQFPNGPGTLVLPQGAAAGAAMSTGLTERGWQVSHVVAYHTVDFPARTDLALMPTPVGILEPSDLTTADIVVLTAPSAARRWATLNVAVRAVIAIGQPTRRTAAQHGIPLAATAATPDATGIATVVDTLP